MFFFSQACLSRSKEQLTQHRGQHAFLHAYSLQNTSHLDCIATAAQGVLLTAALKMRLDGK